MTRDAALGSPVTLSKPKPPAMPSTNQRRTPDTSPNDAQLQRRINMLEGQTRSLELQLRAMRQSTSWRVTAPLRWISQHFRHIVRPAPETGPEPCRDYAEWIVAYDTLGQDAQSDVWDEIGQWSAKPTLSIVLPSSGDSLSSLRDAIESVRSQIYPAWELCIFAAEAGSDVVKALLERFAKEEPRIKVISPATGETASAVSNRVLESASGRWVVLLGQDDRMPAHALYCVAKEIIEHPDARVIYSDEDQVDPAGRRSNPFFKPDWNVDLFQSRNFLSHLAAFEANLLKEAGGFREGFDEAQDYDLTLRCIERVRGEHIRHIPRVLVHRPARSQATPRTDGAGERALNEHFERMGTVAKAESTPHGYRVRFALPSPPPLVSLVIPTRNAAALVRQCVESIVAETAYPHYEILLVDNGSDDPEALAYFSQLKTQHGITVIRDDRDFNYSALNNGAVAQARGELVGLINNDIEVVSPEWLGEMVSLALQPGVGAVGAKLLYPDRTVQHGGVVLGIGGIGSHAHKHFPPEHPGHGGRAQLVQSFSAVTAACLVVRKELYERIGGLDETKLTVAFNDVDLCLRLREAGYRNVWTPYAELLHHESATRGLDVAPEARERFAREEAYMERRWGRWLANDPAYNPNLTLHGEDFDLAWPPRVEPLGSRPRGLPLR
ncbi:MAG: glycosyltransferase family 2 protein [Comamonadaceae bacterium]|nr:MAG: glycosyltransferase family 2 protein [Comamonadaceae bacterium]